MRSGTMMATTAQLEVERRMGERMFEGIMTV
jgi:hypothetical protein